MLCRPAHGSPCGIYHNIQLCGHCEIPSDGSLYRTRRRSGNPACARARLAEPSLKVEIDAARADLAGADNRSAIWRLVMRSINVLATQRISTADRAKIEAADPAVQLIDAGGWFDGEIRETFTAYAAARYLAPNSTVADNLRVVIRSR